ncbi:MAG: biotin-dependent carboxyltransferase family protein [Verrucomicrobia bacterium]|nr:MAG: biotin-dependent carboxyltransferase family protein [Verrucomicrobiota bacterium]
MSHEVFEILDAGLGATLQDRGRVGWRRFGVPPGGAMDQHAAGWANRLLDNPPDAPVVEFLLQGARLKALCDTWIAVTGAAAGASVPTWRAVQVHAGELLRFKAGEAGVWIYLCVEGGFAGKRRLGSASVYARGKLGRPFSRGDVLCRATGAHFELPCGIAGRVVDRDEQRRYESPPPLRVWRGPQWSCFSETDRDVFFAQEWAVSSQSDRIGYRLLGMALKSQTAQILSEPVLVGTIQVATDGQPIVTMRDGPTVGGYPKLGLLEAADSSWLAQCRPGGKVRFHLVG